MIQETSFSVDSPPSYAEAMECVQLSPIHLTQVMLDQQWNSSQNNSATAAIDPEKAFVKEQSMNKKIGRWIIQLTVLILLIFVIIWITCLYIEGL